VAVILGEPGSEELAMFLENALGRLMPTAIRVELGIVIEAQLGPAGQDAADRFLRDAKIDMVPVDADLADRAMSCWRRYGKGRHPAGLNVGDCFTYALAERTGHPVLCTGNDFAVTDIAVMRPGRGLPAAGDTRNPAGQDPGPTRRPVVTGSEDPPG
jgi:ribonuclease VapC